MQQKKKCYWIIGASSGIGKALTFELDKLGHRLIISSRRKEVLHDIHDQLSQSHHIIPIDISDHTSIKTALTVAHSTNTKIDSIIIMAGAYSPGKIEAMDIKNTKHIIDVNLTGCVNFIQQAITLLKEQTDGQIAVCSSVAAYRGLPNGQIYSATKAALTNFTESLKLELEPYNIDVKLISPGFVRTPLTDKNEFNMPMLIEPDEAAKAIVKGLDSKAFEIHFPRRFTYMMKLLRILPNSLYFILAKYMK